MTHRVDVLLQPTGTAPRTAPRHRLTSSTRSRRSTSAQAAASGSIPFTHGFRTSAFVRPFGFAGRRSHSHAWSPATSNGPPFVSPVNATPAFSGRRRTPVRVDAGAAAPRRTDRCRSHRRADRRGELRIRTRRRRARSRPVTLAPPRRRSPTARRSTPQRSAACGSPPAAPRRFAPPRMEFVATSPARLVLPEAICWPAFSNQSQTKVGFRPARGRRGSRTSVTRSPRPGARLAACHPGTAGCRPRHRPPAHSGSMLSAVRITSRHLTRVQRLQDRVARPPRSRCGASTGISPTHTDTRASSAALGLSSMPLTLAGPTSGNARWKPQRLGLELHPVLEVLERLQRQVEEVPRAARRIEHRERAQPIRGIPGTRCSASLRRFVRAARGPGGLRAFQLGRDGGLLRFPTRPAAGGPTTCQRSSKTALYVQLDIRWYMTRGGARWEALAS